MASWGTRTRQGDTCFSGLTTFREANSRRDQWDKLFPDYAPYSVTRNGIVYQGKA